MDNQHTPHDGSLGPEPQSPSPAYHPPVQTIDNSPPTEQLISQHGHEGIKNIISTILIILCAPLVALLLISFVFQSYEVDGPSMESTLQNRDRLIVVKTSRTWAKITNSHYIPDRYDIVIFTKPGFMDYGHTTEKQLIKRVIGLPGERVVVHEGKVTVYNDEHPDGFNPDKSGAYTLMSDTTPGEVDLTVPKNEIFVAGDNRHNSLDSRYFGTVPVDEIVGTLALRIYPIDKAQKF